MSGDEAARVAAGGGRELKPRRTLRMQPGRVLRMQRTYAELRTLLKMAGGIAVGTHTTGQAWMVGLSWYLQSAEAVIRQRF